MQNNIIIIGITGVGKTTIGRLLSQKLNKEFIDLDRSIELRYGVDIATIFEIEAEVGFRQRESDELSRIINTYSNIVLSVGGGCITNPINREILNQDINIVIQLYADIDIVIDRVLKFPQKRPLISGQTEQIRNKMIKLYNERKELYNLISDISINTSFLKPYQVIDLIIQKIYTI